MTPEEILVLLISIIITLSISCMILFVKCYKKCPSDKVMVIYGNVGNNNDGSSLHARCMHGGAAFIIPVLQAYAFLDLTPISFAVELKNALARQDTRINVSARFTVGISTQAGIMQNAAERLLGLTLSKIQELANDIIFGQLRLLIATVYFEEIKESPDKFLNAIACNVESEINKIGLRLINVNVNDISDGSGKSYAI